MCHRAGRDTSALANELSPYEKRLPVLVPSIPMLHLAWLRINGAKTNRLQGEIFAEDLC